MCSSPAAVPNSTGDGKCQGSCRLKVHAARRGDAASFWSSRPYAEQPVTEAVPTRLGEGAVTVELTEPIASPFTAAPIEALPVPWRWLRDVAPGTPGVPMSDGAGGYEIAVGAVQLSYSQLGLRH